MCSSPLIISHIPKTAGTSLKKLVSKFSHDATYIYEGQLALGRPNIKFIGKFRSERKPSVIMGHFSYGARRLLDIPPRYASMFRDPIERLVSLYFHFKAMVDNPIYHGSQNDFKKFH